MDKIMANGYVDAFIVSSDGTMRQVVSGSNTLLYQCADSIAHLFAGIVSYIPRTVSFVYAGTADKSNSFHFSDGDRVSRSQLDIVGDGLSVHDNPIEQNMRFTATSDDYSGNAVTLSAMTKDTGTSEYIYGFLLKDAEGRILAVKKLDTPVQRASGYAMAMSWTVTFDPCVAPPVLSPADDTSFEEEQVVTMSCSTVGAVIRYTTDGSTPVETSPSYSAALTLTETTTIKARAYRAGLSNSSVVSVTYTKV